MDSLQAFSGDSIRGQFHAVILGIHSGYNTEAGQLSALGGADQFSALGVVK